MPDLSHDIAPAIFICELNMIRRVLFLVPFVFLSACGSDSTGSSPVGLEEAKSPPVVPGPRNHVVTLLPGSNPRNVASDHGVSPKFVYDNVLEGFAGSISEAAKAGLLRDSRVAKVELDQEVHAHGEAQPAASWGLDRIDQREEALDGVYRYAATGRGVTVYIVDTGIRYSHNEFGGRAAPGFDAFGGDGSDCYGHGTHVAGTVGGSSFGVAKEASLVSVRVLDCSGGGTASSVVAGLDWIAANATLPAVANLSLGGGGSDAMDEAIRRLTEAGIPVAVSAGNRGMNACFFSPARAPEAMTVAASSPIDEKPSWSNYGDCVDWYAPGVSITSAEHGGDDAFGEKSGTSMASPHTAGAAALFLETHPSASAYEVIGALSTWATPHVVRAGSGPRAPLLYTLGEGWDDGGGAQNSPPTAAFDVTCIGLTCTFTDLSSATNGSVVGWQWDFGDSSFSTVQNPEHIFPAEGTYTVTLTVTDELNGQSSPAGREVQVSPVQEGNLPPTAEFSFSCTDLVCRFVDGSHDSDGMITTWVWDFGDGSTVEVPSASDQEHTYAAEGTYGVTLTVSDDQGASSAITHGVQVTVAPPENQPPEASFSASCTGLRCDFQDGSRDVDGVIVSWRWSFGDGVTAAANSSPGDQTHTFSTAGAYQVTLTVTDDLGSTDTQSQDVNVGVSLSANGHKEKGLHVIDLSWTGLESGDAFIYLDDAPLAMVPNTGTYIHSSDQRGQGTYLFQVCDPDGTVCSNKVTVEF